MQKAAQIQVPRSEQEIARMFDGIARRYDFLNALLSLKQDQRWRKWLVRSMPFRPNGTHLDVATGTGDVLLEAARSHSEYQSHIGVDISAQMLKLAEQKIAQQPSIAAKCNVKIASATVLPFNNESCDCVSISFGLRNVVDKPTAIGEFARVLKSGGALLILEFFLPRRGLLAASFNFYFQHVLPLIGGFFSNRQAYTYLPQSVAGFYDLQELSMRLQAAGFHNIVVKKFLFGACCLVSARRVGV